MPFSLRPAVPSDAESITRVFQAAFKNDHIMMHFHPRTPEGVKWEQDVRFFEGMILGCESGENGGGGRIWVVVDGDGKIVGFSKWDYPHTLTKEQAEKKKRKMMEDRLKRVVEGSNEGLMRDFFEQLGRGREKWVKPEKTFFLHILAVDPAHQRQGLGSMLIRPGLEAADEAGMQTYIEASPDGLPLYLKYGWEPVDEMVIDMEKHGIGSGIEHMPFLMREAGAPNKLEKKVG